jgi:hypothetical protein
MAVHAKDIITEADKRRFLEFVADGHGRAAAARRVNPDYTGSLFARLMSHSNRSYDHEFALEYEQTRADALAAGKRKCFRQMSRASRTLSGNGHIRAMHISVEHQEQFLHDVKEGTPLRQAAEKIGTSLWQLDRLCTHNEDFARAYNEARAIGYPVMQENLRAEAHRQAFAGDYRALRDMLIIHAPEYAVLNRAAKGDHDIDLRSLLEQKLGSLPAEKLDAIIQILEDGGDLPAIEAAVA